MTVVSGETHLGIQETAMIIRPSGSPGPRRMSARLARAAALLFAASLAGCTGPFFYRDVIVPTYRQVDPSVDKPLQAPVQP